jgi:HK97 family phage major capsid protein
MDGLHDAVVMTTQASAPDADKVATLQGILEDFTEEALSLVGGGEGDQDESGEGDDAPGDDGKARLVGPEAVDTALRYVRLYGRPDLAATISSVIASKAADVKEVRTPMGAEAGTETPVLPGTTPPAPASAPAPAAAGPVEGKAINEAMASQLQELLAEKHEREMATAAEAEAAKRIEAEGKAAQAAAEQKAIEEVKFNEMLNAAVDRQRQGASTGRKFVQPGSAIGTKSIDPRKGMADWLLDLRRSKRGDQKAFERLQVLDTEARAEYGLKAVAEGSTASGGYLVPPQYWQAGLAEYRIAAAKVRPLCTVITAVDSDQVLIPRETGIAIVGWTAENAAKPSQDQTFGQIAVNIFALAGISKVSNQLLEDSSPAVDQILRKDLGRTLGQAEDIAFLEGTGNGQPTGILNTTGVLNLAYSSDAAGSGLADSISAAIVAIETNYFGAATALVMHPRNVNILRKVKDTAGRYIFEAGFMPQLTAQLGGPSSFMGGDPQQPGPVGSVWGLPVISDANMATNYSGTTQGGGTESPIIVANWSEAYIFERAGVTVDVSNEAGTAFESNQTWYRGEERIGFTAARQPTAFCYVTGLTASITN